MNSGEHSAWATSTRGTRTFAREESAAAGIGVTARVVGESIVDVIHKGGRTRQFAGGSPLNVAVGLQRAGIDTVLISSVGRDRLGSIVKRHLSQNGVALKQAGPLNLATSRAVATVQSDGSASYEFVIGWDLLPELPDGPITIHHCGSIGAYMSPGAATVLDNFERSKTAVVRSFDPNIRPDLMGEHSQAVQLSARYYNCSDVVKMSDEDAEWLYPGESANEVAARVMATGVGLFVLTQGSQGCLAFSHSDKIYLTASKSEVVDTIGAGDAFMSGLLVGLLSTGAVADLTSRRLSRNQLRKVARYGLASAGVSITRAGAVPPTSNELQTQYVSLE